VSGLGAINDLGGVVTMALYTDVGGAPSGLVAQTSVSPSFTGRNVFPTPATPVTDGTYWVMIEAEGGIPVCADSSLDNTVYFSPLGPANPFGTFPTILPPSKPVTGVSAYNFFVVGAN
jgi:hypothetical protein